MLKLKKIGLTLLIVLISSCQTPEVKKMERCLVDVEFNSCQCHTYEITENRIGQTSETVEYPLSHCDVYIAMPVEDFQQIKNSFKEFYRIKNGE